MTTARATLLADPQPDQKSLFPEQNVGFDNDKYVTEQSAAILRRVNECDGKLYLEFGGKLLWDMHASRVLPGFDPNVKMRLLQRLRDQMDIILCIHAGDIERKKVRADFGITYDADLLKLIDDLRDWNLEVTGVVITRFDGQSSAVAFLNRLERRGIPAFTHKAICGYPADVNLVVSDQGFGANPYIPTTRPLVIVNAPGPNSGKMATCLSQVYHEHRRGTPAGYAKFETFPIWNLPLRHPVNLAYEAATADIRDFNIIDPFHLEAYGEQAVNYNRDVETFPVLKAILERITGRSGYKSPTDMGVNRAGFAIVNDAIVRSAATQEIIRRYLQYTCEFTQGNTDQETVQRVEMLMNELHVTPLKRPVLVAARQAADQAHQRPTKGDQHIYCGAAIQLRDGAILTGVNSPLLHAASSTVLNAIKRLAEIPPKLHLLSPKIIESVSNLKQRILKRSTVSLDLEETLIALSIAATTNPTAELAMEQLKHLRGCEMHMTHMPTPGDDTGLRRLGVNLTCDPQFASKRLFAS